MTLKICLLDLLVAGVVWQEKMAHMDGWVTCQRQCQRLPIIFQLRSLVCLTKEELLLVLIYRITVLEMFVHLLWCRKC
uniref:Putative secreted protein n=1 Tax=Panstrongylus lignarius TaxID=156445 RepID=A0A224XT84_9HEMI